MANGRYEGSGTGYLPTPRCRDTKGFNQRRNQDTLEGALAFGMSIRQQVDFGRFAKAVRRWETVSGMPTPCPQAITGTFYDWVRGMPGEMTDIRWLARRPAPVTEPEGRERLLEPMRRRVILAWSRHPMGFELLPVPLWDQVRRGLIGADATIPATLAPSRFVLEKWRRCTRRRRIPTLAHLSATFDEWMMGLEPGWLTDPNIWEHVPGAHHRNLMIRACGNGVVPQQGELAIRRALLVRERLTGRNEPSVPRKD